MERVAGRRAIPGPLDVYATAVMMLFKNARGSPPGLDGNVNNPSLSTDGVLGTVL